MGKKINFKELLALNSEPNLADDETLINASNVIDKACDDIHNHELWKDIHEYRGDVHRYGVKVDKNNSNPSERVTYMYDAVGMTPAKMNYNTGTFDYGSWKDVWFVKDNKPVMLNYDGSEAYELNPNDYSKKADGSASDIANTSFNGNAMSKIPLVYVSMTEDNNYEYYAVSNVKYDDTYKAIAHTSEDGSIKDFVYLAIYNGCEYNSKIRSLSGKNNIQSKTMDVEWNYAKANGTGWFTRTWGQRTLINILLLIMGKSDDTQTVFGNGNCSGYNSNDSTNHGMKTSGLLNTKGQFFGYNNTNSAVKVFHMENWWGNQYERLAGLMTIDGKLKVSLTGPYNTTGDGYNDVYTYSSNVNGYCTKTKATPYGRIGIAGSGSSSTYTCDYWYTNSNGTYFPIVGGNCNNDLNCGAWYTTVNFTLSNSNWYIGASLSFL